MHRTSIAKSRLGHEIHLQISSFVAGFFFLVFGCIAHAQSDSETLQNMTIEQKIGQLMIWSFSGHQLSKELQKMLRDYQPGALIVFRRNIKTNDQIATFNSEAQKYAKHNLRAPLFIMLDQEGGVVSRLKTSTPTPSALSLGRTGDAKFIESFAKTKGELLVQLGFNMNLAPVLDISNPEKDSFIGSRTFGDDPDTVAQLALAYAHGLSQSGILPTGKHFPGHGGTLQDSHRITAKKMSTLENLERRDLVPFKGFAAADFSGAVMMAHLSLPNIDPTGLPATYSPKIHQLLREKIGFKGLVMTDDLEMAGAIDQGDIGQRSIRAIEAGNDMLMVTGPFAHQKRAFKAVLAAVNSGRLSESRINESVRRILALKSKLSKFTSHKPDKKRTLDALKKFEAVSREVLKKNFDYALKESSQPWLKLALGSRALIASSRYDFFNNFKSTFKGKVEHLHLSPQSLDRAAAVMEKTTLDFLVFYASGSQTARFLARLSPDVRSRTVVINCNHPGEISEPESFFAVLNLGSQSPESGEWLGSALNTSNEIRTPAGDSEKAIETDGQSY